MGGGGGAGGAARAAAGGAGGGGAGAVPGGCGAGRRAASVAERARGAGSCRKMPTEHCARTSCATNHAFCAGVNARTKCAQKYTKFMDILILSLSSLSLSYLILILHKAYGYRRSVFQPSFHPPPRLLTKNPMTQLCHIGCVWHCRLRSKSQ